MQITQALKRAAAARPGALATVCGGRRRTFAQVAQRVARLAGALHGLGVQADDRVGILSLNSDRYIETYLAVPWAGAAINPVNTRWSAAEIAYSLADCDTRVLLVDDPFMHMLPELRKRCASLRTLVHVGNGATPQGLLSYEALITATQPVADATLGGRDLAGVFYTGGTTGFPKGVMLSHDALVYNALVFAAQGVARDREVGLHVAPLFHMAGVALLNTLWTVGGTHVTMPAFEPLAALQALERERIATTVMVPTMIQLLVDHPQCAGFDLAMLRRIGYGGSPISDALLERAALRLPQVEFAQVYGMTELAPVATQLGPELHAPEGRARGKTVSAGQAVLGVDLRVVDPEGHPLPPGVVGEVIVRSPGAMLGYWGKPEETAKALQRAPNEGWMHTGDAGRLDEEGFLTIVDRVKDMIVTGGENVYSVEVEQVVARHRAVAACAVIGVPDDDWGERVHAVVQLKPGAQADADAIRAHCKTLIGGYKCPRSVEFVAALPVSGAGKVLKTQLRELHWAGCMRRVA
ncbi:MAG: long-chain fatty acid--CoA ligase [Rubrivivax sp.]|nr:long-chain fatty acid--CoA ligase [Rubrivivax sp.]